LLLLDIAR